MTTDWLIGAAVVVWLSLPGWLWARRTRLPLPALAGFLSGAVANYALVLALQVCGAGLARPVYVSALAAIGALGVALALRARAEVAGAAQAAPEEGAPGWLWLLAAPAGAAIAWRVLMHPMHGIDTGFRWNHLAEQMAARGTLGFYPPVSAGDYAVYSWPDGIAPLVSSLYFAAYAVAGAGRAALAAPAILAQWILVVFAVHELARREAGPRAGACAVALAAATPVLGWACTMGHETGLTTLGVLGMLVYLPDDGRDGRVGVWLLAGAAAAAAALAREYGAAFALLGTAVAWRRCGASRAWLPMLALATLAVLPWHLRNALRTGNPLFNYDIAGLWPVNGLHALLMATYRSAFSWGTTLAALPGLLAGGAAAALAGGVAGLVLARHRVRTAAAAFAALGIVLWIAALPSTAAGPVYGMRVLAPVLALGAVLGGPVLSSALGKRLLAPWIALVVAGLALDSAARNLVLPSSPYRVPIARWTTLDASIAAYHASAVFDEVARATGSARVLTLGPVEVLRRHGVNAEPLWSPDALAIGDARLTPEAARRALLGKGYAFLYLGRGELNRAYLEQLPFLAGAPAGMLIPVLVRDDYVLFRIAGAR